MNHDEGRSAEQSVSDSGNFRESSVGYKKPPAHSRFKKGQTGNPGGLPRKNPNGLLSLLREKLARPCGDGSLTYAERLVEEWVNEAVASGRNPRKLAAIEGIVAHLEGKAVQRHEVEDTTPEKFRGKTTEELLHFAATGEFPSSTDS